MKWYYRPGHPKASQNGFVKEEDLGGSEAPKALHAPILMDRFYENTKTVDGVDIGSRRKHKEYLKRTGYAVADDFSMTWKKQAEERDKALRGDFDHRERKEAIDRAVWEKFRP